MKKLLGRANAQNKHEEEKERDGERCYAERRELHYCGKSKVERMDYGCEARNEVSKFIGDIGAIRYVLTASFRKPDHHPQKRNRLAKRCIWRYRFQAGVWKCQILN